MTKFYRRRKNFRYPIAYEIWQKLSAKASLTSMGKSSLKNSWNSLVRFASDIRLTKAQVLVRIVRDFAAKEISSSSNRFHC